MYLDSLAGDSHSKLLSKPNTQTSHTHQLHPTQGSTALWLSHSPEVKEMNAKVAYLSHLRNTVNVNSDINEINLPKLKGSASHLPIKSVPVPQSSQKAIQSLKGSLELTDSTQKAISDGHSGSFTHKPDTGTPPESSCIQAVEKVNQPQKLTNDDHSNIGRKKKRKAAAQAKPNVTVFAQIGNENRSNMILNDIPVKQDSQMAVPLTDRNELADYHQ